MTSESPNSVLGGDPKWALFESSLVSFIRNLQSSRICQDFKVAWAVFMIRRAQLLGGRWLDGDDVGSEMPT